MALTALNARPGITIPIGENGFTIYYYAIVIVFGILCAAGVVALLFKRRNIPADWTLDFLLCVLPLGIVGARTFSVLTDPNSSITEWFTGFRSGGLSIIGGIIGGALGVILFCVIHRINFLRVADCLVPGVALAQSIGRWGNFFNQEVYGPLITNPSLQWFPLAVQIGDEWHAAFFFYESVLDILLFVVLFTLMWKFLKKPHGLSAGIYLAWYGIVRSIMEPLRDSEYILGHDIPISLVFAVLMAACGIILILSVLLYNRNKYGSATGAVVGEPLAILPAYYTAEQRKEMAKKAEAESLKEHAGKKDEEPPEEDGEGKDV